MPPAAPLGLSWWPASGEEHESCKGSRKWLPLQSGLLHGAACTCLVSEQVREQELGKSCSNQQYQQPLCLRLPAVWEAPRKVTLLCLHFFEHLHLSYLACRLFGACDFCKPDSHPSWHLWPVRIYVEPDLRGHHCRSRAQRRSAACRTTSSSVAQRRAC